MPLTLPVPLPLPVLLRLPLGEAEGVWLGGLLREGRALADRVACRVGAGAPETTPPREGAPVGVALPNLAPPGLPPPPRPGGLPWLTPEADTLEEALGLAVAEGESEEEVDSLELADPEAESLGERMGRGEALVEGEAEGEGLPLELPLVDTLVLMLPVALPGGGGLNAMPSPLSPPPLLPAPAAPRLVGVPRLERMAGRVKWAVFVPVRVEVWVCVEVPTPGPEAVGVGRGEGEAPRDALPTALPVGLEVAVVTSWSSTTSTRVTTGRVTLTYVVFATMVTLNASGPPPKAVERLPPGGMRQVALAAMAARVAG